MQRTVIIDALKSTQFNEPINVRGWVRSRRGNKQVQFIALNDGSTINNIQIVADTEKFPEQMLKVSPTPLTVVAVAESTVAHGGIADEEQYGTAATSARSADRSYLIGLCQ